MQCPSCRNEASDSDTFCGTCGTQLASVCPNCRTRNGLQARFCNFCGKPLEAAQALGERKVVTVLFADIVGSTELISELDPEAALSYLPPAIARMGAAVGQFNGQVVRTMGDGLMAMFGAPRTDESHALQACRAALAMQQSLTDNGIAIRVGIHSGEVVSGLTIELTREQGAYGATIHLASRLEHTAEPGTICISEATFHLVRLYCDALPLGPHPMRGFSHPVEVHRLLGLKPANTSEQFRNSALTVLHGRDAEFARLRQAFEEARQGRGGAIGIVAPPGVGKSRLCFEFAEYCRSGAVPVVEARASPYDYSGPLQPFLEFLRAYFRILPKDDAETARNRISAKVEALGGSIEVEAPILAGMLGIADRKSPAPVLDPKARQARLFNALGNLIRAAGRARVVFIVEDLHWFDAGSAEFLGWLVEAVAGTHILLVMTYRPSFQPAWAASPAFTELQLPELGAADMTAVVAGLAGADPSLADMRARIVERSGGNPFFAEELIRSLVERGALSGEPGRYRLGEPDRIETLPATVQAVIGARIDRLRDPEKAVLQMGATVGREFPLPVLEAIAGLAREELTAILDRLCAAELIRKELTRDGSDVFAFRHPLIQEVAYAMQLKPRRASLHAGVAKAIEKFHHNRLDEYADLVSHHLEAAGELAAAASYASRAALWIGTTHASQALSSWRKVRSLLAGVPRSAETDTLRIMAGGQIVGFGWREGMSADEARPFAEEALQLARETRNLVAEILLIAGYGRIIAATGPADDYVEHAERAYGMATDASQQTLLQAILCQAYSFAGKLGQALNAGDTALAGIDKISKFHQQLLGFNIGRWVESLRARVLVRMGEFAEARQALEQLIATEADHPDPAVQFIPHQAFAELAWLSSNAEMALKHAGRLTEIARSAENTYVGVFARASTAIARSLAGDHADAARQLEEALSFARQARTGLEYEPDMLASLAEVQRRAERPADAIRVARTAIAAAQERCARLAECRASITLAAALLASPDDGERAEGETWHLHAERLIETTAAAGLEALLAVAGLSRPALPHVMSGQEA